MSLFLLNIKKGILCLSLFAINVAASVTDESLTLTPFVTTWQTDGSNNIIIPLTVSGYDFNVDWGDGTVETKTGSPGNISHTYTSSGIKTVSITPNTPKGFPRIYVNNFGNRNLLQTTESWGSGIWGAAVDRAFYGASNLEVNATDTPDFSATTNFQYMFANCTSVTGTNGFANWTLNTNPTANVSFSNMFQSTAQFNGDISNWDVSRGNTFGAMFYNTQKFNQNIGSWNVSNATDMNHMFRSTLLFDQDLSGWDVSSVTKMAFMFYDTRAFNSPLTWGTKTANVTTMAFMFQSSRVFNKDISGWDVSSVTDMSSMFYFAQVFNQNISAWDVSNVTNMSSMLRSMPLFNQPLNWGTKTGKVTNMEQMLRDSPQFNQDINSWDVSKVTNTLHMFYNATSFNQNISGWDVSSVTNMTGMFNLADAFNSPLNWGVKTANVTNMSRMFFNATSFNRDISTWNISKLTNLNSFLVNVKLSRANYDALLLGWSTLDAGETLVPVNLNAHFGSSKYSDTPTVLTARNTTLIANKGWAITDGGMDADVILPEIASNALASDNTTINITFSENVYRTDIGSGVLETTDFLFAISGGTATLNTTTPSSISTSDNLTFILGIDMSGAPDGTEMLTVTPVANSIFDVSGNIASATQSNNTAQLNDFSVPIITGPNSETGLNSAVSLNENIAAVFTFSADETVNWTLGSANDAGLFGIDSSGNLVFTTAPDYETPLSTLSSNTYVVEVIATDAASNTTTQTLSISVLDIANSTFVTFAAITKQYFAGTHTISVPTTNNTNPIVYTSDNAAVATVSGSVITFTGVGTANITATQAADASYEGNSVSSLLTVLGKDLVSKYGGISSTDVNYISANGNVGGSLGIDKYGKIHNIYENADAPIIGTAEAGNAKALVSFTAPANTGGSPITSYTATSSPGSFIGSLTQSGSGTITVTGLTNGTAYTFTVVANNAVGVSSASAVSNAVTPLASLAKIGDLHQGGIIFYLDGSGGGLIAATTDQSSGAKWCSTNTSTSGADGTAIGTGAQNTIDIEAGCTTSGTAADICANLTLGGYSDWFLPSRDEMYLMYENIGGGNALGLGDVGGISYYNYWTSSEYSHNAAWLFYSGGGYMNFMYKTQHRYVRAVRAF